METSLRPDAVLRYDDHTDGVVDLHLPAEPDGRVLVLLHGGFWKTAYDRRHTRPMARALAETGFTVATPEYRRVGPGGGGGWPATGADVRSAVDQLPGLLTDLGLPSPRWTGAVGHSAGGQLALWLAATGTPLDRVVALAPVSDLREAIRLGLGSDAARAFLGSSDPDPADPMVLLDRRPTVPVTVVHGVDDDTVPVGLTRALVVRHPWIVVREVPGGHYEPIDPTSAVWPVVVETLTAG